MRWLIISVPDSSKKLPNSRANYLKLTTQISALDAEKNEFTGQRVEKLEVAEKARRERDREAGHVECFRLSCFRDHQAPKPKRPSRAPPSSSLTSEAKSSR